MEHVTPKLCQSVVRERLAEYVKYNTNLKKMFSGSPTEVSRWCILIQNGLKDASSCKEVPFGGLHDGRQHLGGQISQNRQKGAFLSVFSVCEQNEEEWRHRRITSLASAASQGPGPHYAKAYI